MKQDKKQSVQLAVLGVLVVLFVGFVSFNFMAPKARSGATNQTQPAASTTKGPSADSSSSAEETESVGPAPVVAGVFPDLVSTPARRDPFTPQKLPGAALDAKPDWRASTTSKSVASVANTHGNPFTKVPPIAVPTLNPFGNSDVRSAQASTATVSVEPEKTPDFVLTGVLRGSENVAIIRSGENGRYVVKQGQFIDGRYKVLYITGDGVVLADRDRRIHVKLGGVKNAS